MNIAPIARWGQAAVSMEAADGFVVAIQVHQDAVEMEVVQRVVMIRLRDRLERV